MEITQEEKAAFLQRAVINSSVEELEKKGAYYGQHYIDKYRGTAF